MNFTEERLKQNEELEAKILEINQRIEELKQKKRELINELLIKNSSYEYNL